jgi:hypothetical protein
MHVKKKGFAICLSGKNNEAKGKESTVETGAISHTPKG